LALVTGGSTLAWMAAAQIPVASAEAALPANSIALHNATAGTADNCLAEGAY